ncbi:MAG: LLM class flavin-dependent oxidoreductase [Dehalococcoidia bacterium]|nr:LLM class flavin-dependent oxidoreductase [Dehalococcoidia bacterium]
MATTEPEAWNATERPIPCTTIHALIEERASLLASKKALISGTESLTYAELDRRANQLARHLLALGLRREEIVGIALDRTPALVVAVLAVLKAGGAYLPLDPHYPSGRLRFMLEDSGARFVVTESPLAAQFATGQTRPITLDTDRDTLAGLPGTAPLVEVDPTHLAYVIYTSGSTGTPKGVMIEHRNVVNFFAGMTDRLAPGDPPGTWLAVTSLSFDISVLELLWTLATGFTVVLFSGDLARLDRPAPAARSEDAAFSLFYFAANETGGTPSTYDLLLAGARFADEHGFEAVWTPERHFHPFGGLYPNPAVTGAAVAAVTQRVAVRAGSCVLPLHPTVRMAEDWAVIDNLSNGRVGIAFASGWQPNDFVLNPAGFAGNRARLEAAVVEVQRLWRGETVDMPGPAGDRIPVSTLPRPVQPELPTWITAAGNIETFRLAGRMGANLLTHLLGQDLDTLAGKLAAYREAWRAAGHPGGQGRITLMLHTYVAGSTEEARQRALGPLREYLRSSADLLRHVAWSFPVFQGRMPAAEGDLLEGLSPGEVDALLDHAAERYFRDGSLIGSVEQCIGVARSAFELGVNEIACLVDFGIDAEDVLDALPHLDAVRQAFAAPAEEEDIAALIQRHGVTHLQCTPSLLGLLLEVPAIRVALAQLDVVCVGGEAFPVSLARALRETTSARMLNMYGPTETTIWSSVYELTGDEQATIPIGTPIANTSCYVLDGSLGPTPPGEVGDLWIGGLGVARGYLGRPDLTAERFIASPFRPGERLYRTGDLARRRAGGVLEFCGRVDHQVKILGHRIELGEIEDALRSHPGIAECVVMALADGDASPQLVAHIVPRQPVLNLEDVRAALKTRLPLVMLPSQFVLLDRLPLTPNGKVDRKALPAPGASTAAASAPPGVPAMAPDMLEERIAEVWARVLGRPVLDRDANLFDSGGNSLLAVRLHRRLRDDLGLQLKLTDIFKHPTIRQLAAHLAEGEPNNGVTVAASSRAGLRRARASSSARG